MAHRLLQSEEPIRTKVTHKGRFKLPTFNGKFGLAFYLGGQEVFLGLTIIPVTLEEIVRKRTIPPSKGKVRFVNLSSE